MEDWQQPTPSVAIGDPVAIAHPTNDATQFLIRRELFIKSSDPFLGLEHEERFHIWKALLQNRFQGVPLTPLDEIGVLQANTAGEAKKLVDRNCGSYLAAGDTDPSLALKNIWAQLARRYGATATVAHSLRKKLSQFPVVADDKNLGKSMRELHDLCVVIPNLRTVDFPEGVRPVWEKLPTHLQNRWRSKGTKYETANGHVHQPFTFFLEFLNSIAEEFSNHSYTRSKTNKQTEVGVQTMF